MFVHNTVFAAVILATAGCASGYRYGGVDSPTERASGRIEIRVENRYQLDATVYLLPERRTIVRGLTAYTGHAVKHVSAFASRLEFLVRFLGSNDELRVPLTFDVAPGGCVNIIIESNLSGSGAWGCLDN